MKTIALLLFSFYSLTSFSQNFPGADIQLLIGKELKVKSRDKDQQKLGYADFFTNESLESRYACCQSYNSHYDSLVGKVFIATEFITYTDVIGAKKYKLVIENPKTGVLYFSYNPKNEHSFPFEVIGGLSFPQGYFCKDIEESKTSTRITYSSPVSDRVSFMKIKKADSVHVYLTITEHGDDLKGNEKGVIILLEKGLKIEKPEVLLEADSKELTAVHEYSASFELDKNDIKLLTENKITGSKLHIYNGTISGGEKLKEYFKCILEK